MLSRTILISLPFSSITVSALCAQLGFDGVVELDIRELRAAYDSFLGLGRQCVPAGHVVQIFLHDHIAAAGKPRVLLADYGGVHRVLAGRVLGAVNKPKQVTTVEVAKAVHLVHRRSGPLQSRHDLRRQLEAKIHPFGADVEQQVAGCGDRMARSSAKFTKRMKLGRPRLPEEPVPGLRTEPHDAGEIFTWLAKSDRTEQRREVGAQGLHFRNGVAARVDRHNQKYRRPRQRRGYRLAGRARSASRCGHGHRKELHRVRRNDRSARYGVDLRCGNPCLRSMRASPEARMGDINHWLLYMSGPLGQVSRLCSRSTRGRSREWRVLTLMAALRH